MVCPLCQSTSMQSYAQDAFAEKYFLCSLCDGVFLEEKLRLGLSKEKKRYEIHQNQIDSPSYISYLQSVYEELKHVPLERGKSLDYGSGAEKGLELFLKKEGISVESFDPIFWPDTNVMKNSYNCIFAIEVVEHFYDPSKEFLNIDSLLMKGGYILVRTSLRPNTVDGFKNWWYRRDPTHVFFYSHNTMLYIAKAFSWELARENPPFFHFIKQ